MSVRLAKAAEGSRERSCRRFLPPRGASWLAPGGLPQHADAVEAGFVEAGGFLHELRSSGTRTCHTRLSSWRSPPHSPSSGARSADGRGKAEAERSWFWSVTLGEMYGSSTESRIARDVPRSSNGSRIAGGQAPVDG